MKYLKVPIVLLTLHEKQPSVAIILSEFMETESIGNVGIFSPKFGTIPELPIGLIVDKQCP